ncbi:MAG TPA: aminoacyl-tRNA hydrolase [Candidatus Limnocylindrales bacterium]|nr:aminoacyl-tRNA hydrolase [Candidatus Limnocylindrales bacterium]
MPEADPAKLCVVGLGNPGEEYVGTRHNVGFEVVDVLAARFDTHIRRPEFGALTAVLSICRSEVFVMKPQTYMNRSGRSAAEALQALALRPDRLLAVYDDLDLPLGRLRIRQGGSTGGHRGVASLVAELGSEDFARLRVGIGRPPAGVATIDHVLSRFTAAESEAAARAVAMAADAIESIVRTGIRAAMEIFNRAPVPPQLAAS